MIANLSPMPTVQKVRIFAAMRLYLAEWRRYRGLSQEALAEKAGLNYVTLSRIETSGSARASSVQKIAKALGTTVEKLYEHPPVERMAVPEETPEQALANVKRFMLHGDLTMQQVLETLAAIQAERDRRGMK